MNPAEEKNAGSHCSANVIKCWLNNKVCTDDINDTPILGSCWFMRIDNMEAALLPDECTDLVSTNRLGHGWANQKLTNQQAIFRAGCKDGCDLGCDWLHGSCSRFVDQSGALNSMIKSLNLTLHIIYPPRCWWTSPI